MQIPIEALDNLVLLINNRSQEKDRRILLGAAAKAYGWWRVADKKSHRSGILYL